MSAEDRLRDATAPDEEGARERALLRLRADERAPRGRARRAAGAPRAAAPWRGASAVVGARSPPRSARPARRSPTGSGRRSGCARSSPPTARRAPTGRPPAGGCSCRPPARRGSSSRAASAGGSARGAARRGRRTARFVIAWKGRRLAALDRRGKVRWSLQRPAAGAARALVAERLPRRLPLGRRPARGRRRRHRRPPPRTARASRRWPGGRAGRTCSPTPPAATSTSLDVDSGVRLARIQLPRRLRPDRLVGRRHAPVRQPPPLDRRLRRARAPHRPHPDAGRQTVTTFVPARGGSLVAVARRDRTVERGRADGPGSRDRVLFRADGRFSRLRFSPSGRWLLVAWPLADQWVYLRPGASGAARVLAAPRVTRRFSGRGFPQLQGWCCPPDWGRP